MASIYSTGPVLIYTNVSGTAAFFGTGQQAPDIQIKAEFEPVMNDLGGTRVPFDRLYESEEGVTSVVVNRYNEGLLEAMMARPRPAVSVAGVNASGEIGSLMGAEGLAYTIWLVFPYASKAFQAAAALGAGNGAQSGYRFPYSWLIGPEQIKGGTKDKQINCVWQHQRGWTSAPTTPSGPAQSNTGGLSVGSFLLYDHATAGLSGLN